MKRWKKMMAFCFAFLMAFVMFGSSVEAANGPNEQDWSSAYIVIDDGSANPKQLYNANKSVTISTVKNIRYDKKTNTLTLNGYQEAEKRIVANEMGDDFKVKVVGNNQIQGIAVWGYSYGGSLTLEGNGSLEINKNRVQGEPIFLMAEEANAQFKVKQGVTLKVYRDNKFPSSIVVSYSAAAKDGSKKYASWKITSMKGIVKKVKITGSKPVKAGKKLKLKAKVTATKKANTKLLWTSGNAKYATVNAKGIVTTKKSAKGKTVKITAMATDGSGKKHTVKIKIK